MERVTGCVWGCWFHESQSFFPLPTPQTPRSHSDMKGLYLLCGPLPGLGPGGDFPLNRCHFGERKWRSESGQGERCLKGRD